jgi:hypothetical protein
MLGKTEPEKDCKPVGHVEPDRLSVIDESLNARPLDSRFSLQSFVRDAALDDRFPQKRCNR